MSIELVMPKALEPSSSFSMFSIPREKIKYWKCLKKMALCYLWFSLIKKCEAINKISTGISVDIRGGTGRHRNLKAYWNDNSIHLYCLAPQIHRNKGINTSPSKCFFSLFLKPKMGIINLPLTQAPDSCHLWLLLCLSSPSGLNTWCIFLLL